MLTWEHWAQQRSRRFFRYGLDELFLPADVKLREILEQHHALRVDPTQTLPGKILF